MNGWEEVSNENEPGLEVYFKLTEAQLRAKNEREKGIFIAEAQTVVETALSAGCTPVSVLCDRSILSESVFQTVERCREANPHLTAFLADRALMTKMTGFELTRGLLAAMKRPAPRNAPELCRRSKRIAVLEGVSDAGNIGAVLRSAAGLGVDAVLLTPDCCDPLCRRAIRVSMGTVFLVPWAYAGSGPEIAAELRALGFVCAALALTKDAVPLEDLRRARGEKLALFLGSEGYGLKGETIAACDRTAIIPMYNGVDSLNVAAAGAVAFYELCRGRDDPEKEEKQEGMK